MAGQPLAYGGRLLQSHIEDQGVAFAQQLAPAHEGKALLARARLQMAGDERHRAGDASMGEGDIATGGAAQGCRDARHHGKGDVVLAQAERLLATATKDIRIAPLEPYHPFSLLAQLHQQGIDRLLGEIVFTAALAHIVALGMLGDQLQYLLAHQAVVDHHFCLLDEAQGLEGQQLHITGASAHQCHASCCPVHASLLAAH